MSGRSPEEIRASIEANRMALAVSIEKLRGEVAEITDWRKQLDEHQRPALIGAALPASCWGAGSPCSGAGAASRRRALVRGQRSSLAGTPPTPISPGPV